LKRGIRCTTMAQLELVLTRAGSATLDLNIQWPPEPDTLELIASWQCPIRSIKVWSNSKQSFSSRRFRGLNVQPLNYLQISNIDWRQAKGLMDLALLSSCSKITLGMHYGRSILLPFKHKLFERVEHLELSICE
jgi:hypothetical protein